MTDTKIFERVEALLKEEGFTHISKNRSTHSGTISAQKGPQQLVMHITDQVEQPFHSTQSETHLARAPHVKLTARLTGISPNGQGQVLQQAGQSGAMHATEHKK